MYTVNVTNKKEIDDIIEHRIPKGRFIFQEGDLFVGVDNATGDAWTEDFEDFQTCISWLFEYCSE